MRMVRVVPLRVARILACLGPIMLGTISAAQSEVVCNRETVGMLISPDKKWVALVREEDCSDGGFVTFWTNAVQLVPREALDTLKLAPSPEGSKHEDDVLVVQMSPSDPPPLLKWLSPRVLQITIPNISGIGLQKSSYHDVTVAIRFDPDDPVAREKWKKDHGLVK
jgi:hypothetical protein